MHPPLCPVFGTDKALPGVSASGHCAAYSAIVKNSLDHETPISNYNDTDFFFVAEYQHILKPVCGAIVTCGALCITIWELAVAILNICIVSMRIGARPWGSGEGGGTNINL